MKVCRGCKIEKSLDDFYKLSTMKDGRLNYCKECVKVQNASWRKKNKERVLVYDKARSKASQKNSPRYRELKRKRNQKYRGRTKVPSSILRELYKGRPNKCSRCGEEGEVQAHHPDYTKPKQVEWVCRFCHKVADKERVNEVQGNIR